MVELQVFVKEQHTMAREEREKERTLEKEKARDKAYGCKRRNETNRVVNRKGESSRRDKNVRWLKMKTRRKNC